MAYKQTPYRIVDGGTGATTASGARTNLGVPATTAVMLLDGTQSMAANMNLGSNRIVSVADPTSAQDAATKAYVDSQIQGVTDIKQSVRVATTANITLSGAQTIDGVSAIAGDRVLVKDQTTAADNGIYVVAAGAWSRSTDADTSSEVTAGLFTFVEEGTANGDSGWILITDNPITLGTTSLSFTQFTGLGQITAGAGLTKTGNTIDVVGTAGRITVNANDIDIASTYVGQTSITTLGTITTGTWTGTTIAVANGGTGATTASGARTNLSAAPSAAQYLTLALDSELSAERTLVGTANRITLTDGGANGNATLDIGTDVVTLTGTQTLTNKTLTSPQVNTPKIVHSISTKTANYTLDIATDDVIVFNITAVATASLPTAASASGYRFTVKNRVGSTAVLTIDPNGAETIDDATTFDLQAGDSVDIISDGTRWLIV